MFYEFYDNNMNKRMVNTNFIVEIKETMGHAVIVTTTDEIVTTESYERVKKNLTKGA